MARTRNVYRVTSRATGAAATRGSFWRLALAHPDYGPLALGFACHLGLGLLRGDDRPLRRR